jgi:apolipoprotein N-acyltransferase
MPAQHASLGALRAAESGLPVVQAALTGVSAAYDARGRRLAALPTQRRAAIVVTISLARRHTPYDAVGNVVPVACGVLLVGGLLVARGARPRSRRAPGR